jgi:Ca2+-binding EF-hand superfamily protein
LKNWIDKKIAADGQGNGWSVFKSHMSVLKIAHKNAAEISDSDSSAFAAQVVDALEFKTLLLHLFATSILWTHFENADNWEESGNAGKHQLDFEQFRLACTTLTSTHEHENLSDEQIQEDFDMLDANRNGYIGFIEVCNFCCRFVTEDVSGEDFGPISTKARKLLGSSTKVGDVTEDLSAGAKKYFESHTADEIDANAMAELKLQFEKESAMVEELTKNLHLSGDGQQAASGGAPAEDSGAGAGATETEAVAV